MTQLTDAQLKKIEGFIGYGKPDAEVIFFGLEEGGGGYSNVFTRITTSNYTYLDCKRFHIDRLKINNLHSDIDSNNVEFQPVWRFMSYLMLRLKGISKEQIIENNKYLLRDYQNNYLGSTNCQGNTLLTEIYPIPCERYNIWGTKSEPYNKFIPQYNSKNEYRIKVLKQRKKIIQQVINSDLFSAKVIICYGKAGWPEFKKFFGYFKVKFDVMKSCSSCMIGFLNDNVPVILTPFFGQGQMTYEILEKLKDEIKACNNAS